MMVSVEQLASAVSHGPVFPTLVFVLTGPNDLSGWFVCEDIRY